MELTYDSHKALIAVIPALMMAVWNDDGVLGLAMWHCQTFYVFLCLL